MLIIIFRILIFFVILHLLGKIVRFLGKFLFYEFLRRNQKKSAQSKGSKKSSGVKSDTFDAEYRVMDEK